MRVRTTSTALIAIAGILVGGAAGALAYDLLHSGTSAGHTDDRARSDAYFAGLRAGEAQGRQEGRAMQEGAALPTTSRRPVRDAFDAGYTAGANDAFAGYDGGWTVAVPYLVTLAGGRGQIVYRIDSRTPVQARVNYYLCANGHDICQERRP